MKAVAGSATRPFQLAVPDAKLAAIANLVREAPLARSMFDDGWDTGMSVAWLSDLREHWLQRFDWRGIEARLNRHLQFLTEIDGVTLHYYHVPGRGPAPKPVLICHGWPYSIFSFADVIDRLTDPARFGGDAKDALTVVVPSIPSYAYSSAANPPLGPLGTLRLFRRLMRDVLGYKRFGVQGGDIGSLIAIYLAHEFPGDVTGMHLNIGPVPEPGPEEMPAAERAWRDAGSAYLAAEFDYMRMQGNKPMMIGAALQSSPLATAAWIAEKFWAWTDHDGTLDTLISKDRLLTEVMAYVVTDTIATSFGMYRMIRDELHYRFHPGGKLSTLTALFLGPKEYAFANPPREIAERHYQIGRFTQPGRGGHLPFLEQPKAFSEDIIAFFGEVTNKT